jgi:alkyl hydroperoxide reductase subunit AhpC
MDPAAFFPSSTAAYYRKHAARVRELAAETTTPVIKDHLHDVARQYDVLADKADEAGRLGAHQG